MRGDQVLLVVGPAVAAGGGAAAARGQPGRPAGQLARGGGRAHRGRLKGWRRAGRAQTMAVMTGRRRDRERHAGAARPFPAAGRARRSLVLLAAGGVRVPRLGGRARAAAGGRADHHLRPGELVDLSAGRVGAATSCGSATTAPVPSSVTSVDASSRGLRMRMRDAGRRRIDVGGEVDIPLSARVTCSRRHRRRPSRPAGRDRRAPGGRRHHHPSGRARLRRRSCWTSPRRCATCGPAAGPRALRAGAPAGLTLEPDPPSVPSGCQSARR